MIIEEIKNAQMQSRRDRNYFRTGVLTTLFGEASKIGKDSGNRQTTDEECVQIIKKFIKNIKITMKLTDKMSDVLNKELKILSEFLPDEISDEDLENQIVIIINEMKNENPESRIVIGPVMKRLKLQIDNFDGRTASTLIKTILTQTGDE